MKLVTRELPKIDRVACPWLTARLIDTEQKFFYGSAAEVLAVAEKTGATPYGIPGVAISRVGDFCSFDDFFTKYELTIPALRQLAEIVRGADTSQLQSAPQSAGLFAIFLGLSATFSDGHDLLKHGMVMYDALYAWGRQCQGKAHNRSPAMQ